MSKLSDYLMNNTPAANVPEGAAPGYEDDGSSDDSGFSVSSIQNVASSILDALSHPSFLQGGTVIAPDYTPRQLDDDASDVPIQEANPTYQPYAASTALNNFIQDHTTVIAPNYTPRPLDDSVYSDIPGTPVASGQFGELEDESVRDERMKDSADYMAANWPRLYGGAVGAAEGFANVVGGIQNAVGGGNGILTNVQRAEEGMQDYRDQWNNTYGDSYFLNPNKFATDVGSGIGSTVPIMALSALMPGAAVAGGTRALTSALSRAGLGRLAMSKAGQALIADTVRSIPTSNLADSLSEYGTVVNDMMQNGMSEDEARRRAIPMFFKNMALDTFTVPLELGVMKGGKGIATGLLGRSAGEGMAKSIAKGAARTGMLAGASGLTEGYQEGAQNALENDVESNRDGGWYNPFTWTNEDWEAARGGFVGGALMGVPGNVAAGFHPEARQAPLSAESREQAQSIKDTLSHGKPKGMSNAAYNAYIELANSGNPDLIKQAASSLESFQESQGNSYSESTDDAATEAYKDYEAYDQKQEIENFLNNNTVEQIGGEDNYNWLYGVLRNGTPEEVQQAYDTVIAAEKATAEQEAKNRPARSSGSVSPNTGNAMVNAVIQAANDSGVDPRLALAIAARESGGDDINAIHMPDPHDGIYGIMQAQDETVADLGLDSQYPDWQTDPYQNAMVGMAILKSKIANEDGDVWAGVRDYNGAGEEAEQYRQLVKNNYDNMGDIGSGGNVEAPNEAFYDLSDAMNPQVDGMDPNTMAKMNLLARDFYQKYGHRLLVTSLKRNGDGSSYHDEGHAFDFSDDFLEQNPDARDWLVQQGEKYGLKGLDEFSHPVETTDGGNVHFTDHGGPVPGGVSGKVTSDNGQFERELDQAAQEAKSDMDKIQAQSDQAMNEIMNDDSTEKTAQEAQKDAENAQKQAEESQQSTQDAVIPDVAQTIRDTSSNIDEINALDGMFTKDGNGNDKFIDTPENRDFIKANYKDEITKAVNDAMSKKKAPIATPVPKNKQQTPHARLGRILATYDRKDPKFKEYMNTFRNGTEQEQRKLADDLQTTQELERANSLKGNPLTSQQGQNTLQNVPRQGVEAPEQPEQANPPAQVKESLETQKKRNAYLSKKQKLMERVPAGRTAKVHASTNDAGFDATYKIVPAGDITASHNTDYAVNDLYPAELQPRDRNRPQMRGQVEKMAKTMKPELLAESQFVNEGAPIVNNSGVVLNGNGRVMAIQKAYQGLTDSHKKSAKAYKDFLASIAPSLGIAPEKVQSMEHPVLVRQAADDADTKAIINSTEGGAKLGGAEQAKADADRLKLSTLEQFVDNGTGEFMNPSNREFRRAAASDVFSDAEGNSVFNEKGDLSPTGQFRIRNAIFAKAYDDDYLLTQLSEATDNNSKNIMNAMIAAAPEVAKVNESIKNGTLYSDYDISDVITKTAKTIMSLRNEGKPLSFHLRETDLFSQGESEAEQLVLEFIERNKFKSRTIADMYKGACDRIFAVGSPKQSKLFDSEDAPRISLENIISNAIQEVEHGQSLFDTAEEKPAEKAVPEVPDNRQAEPAGSGRVHQQEAGRVQSQEKEGNEVDEKSKQSNHVNAEPQQTESKDKESTHAEEGSQGDVQAQQDVNDAALSIGGKIFQLIERRKPRRYDKKAILHYLKSVYITPYEENGAYYIDIDNFEIEKTIKVSKKDYDYAAKYTKDGKWVGSYYQQQDNKEIKKAAPNDADIRFGTVEDAEKAVMEAFGVKGHKKPASTPSLQHKARPKVAPKKTVKKAAIKDDAKIEKTFHLLDDSDEALETEKKAILEELSHLSANPAFNPVLMYHLLKFGAIHVQRGLNEFARWAKAMKDTLPQSEPFLHSVWASLQSMPNHAKLDEKQLTAAIRYVGSLYDHGMTDKVDLRKSFIATLGVKNAKYFDAVYNAVMEYPSIEELKGANDNVNSNVPELVARSGEGASENAVGENRIQGRTAVRGSRQDTAQTGKEPQKQGMGHDSLSSGSTSTGRTAGNRRVQTQESKDSTGSTGSTELPGSVRAGLERVPDDDQRRPAELVRAVENRPQHEDPVEKVQEEQKNKHLNEIKKALPMLLPQQAEDVCIAEDRFKEHSGMMFTNGTGTGKTYTGLGVVKRFADAGKKNILIIAPSDGILKQWEEAATKDFGITLTRLNSTKDAGEGAVTATYANVGANQALVNRDFDLVITDESHNLMGSESATPTDALKLVRAVTGHKDGFQRYHHDKHPEISSKLDKLHEEIKKLRKRDSQIDKERKETHDPSLNDESRKIRDKIEKLEEEMSKWHEKLEAFKGADEKAFAEKQPSKILFLSATPFQYVADLDYANGYLFDYADYGPMEQQGYNQANGRENFYMENFGYKMRYNRLERPGSDVDTDLMEREFNRKMVESGAMHGRMLSSAYDYDRGFIRVDAGIGKKIDEGFDWLRDQPKYSELSDFLRGRFTGQQKYYLLEAIKAKQAIPLIKEYLKEGKKVVIFHNFNKGGADNPFAISREGMDHLERLDSELADHILEQYHEFQAERPDLADLDLNDLKSPIETLSKAFGDELVLYNGTLSKGKREKNKNSFNNDDSKTKIILVQSAAGQAGVSLHDTTGKHQRALINLGLPTRPSEAIQQEGRIYRVGNKSNAIFRYLNTGTYMEQMAFATKLAERAGTVENIALGEMARSLKQAYVEAFEESQEGDGWKKYLPGSKTEGTGGKANDYRQEQATDFDRAKAVYFGKQKKNSRTKSQEGHDYFATPEPIGYKMVQWLQSKPGQSLLEPSAGDGAIARWMPDNTYNTVVEPSRDLTPKLMRNVAGAKVVESTFENFDLHNKFDGIAMNPPFGHGGKTAVEHVAKAYQHLKDGGRLIAIIPDGSACQKRFDKWFYGDPEAKRKADRGIADGVLMADIHLPSVTFDRAGTNVNTRMVVIDKYTDEGTRQVAEAEARGRIDIDADDVNELFDRIEGMDMPERLDMSDEKKQTSIRKVGQQLSRSKEELKAEIKEAFPNAKEIKDEGDRMTFTMPNGSHIVVDMKNEIVLTDKELAQAKKDHHIDDNGNVIVEGYAQLHGKDAYMALSQGSRENTGFHEAYHLAEGAVLTDREKAAIKKAIPDAEKRADKYAEWVEARKHGRGTAWGKLFQKIKDFAMKMRKIFTGVETVNDVFRQIESGEVWERSANNSNQLGRYSMYAKRKLKEDMQAFAKKIDDFMNNKLPSNEYVRVMDTPLVLNLIGEKMLPVYISPRVLDKVLHWKHGLEISPEVLKEIPRRIADPIFILKAIDNKGIEDISSKIIVVDLKDNNGATIMIPFVMNQKTRDRNKITGNIIKSVYGKTIGKGNNHPNNTWYINRLMRGDCIYINKKRTDHWLTGINTSARTPNGPLVVDSFNLSNIIADETDLGKLKKDNPTHYSIQEQDQKISNEAKKRFMNHIEVSRKQADENAIGVHRTLLQSPSRIAEKKKYFKPFFKMADDAMNLLTKLRADYQRHLDSALDLSKKDKASLQELLWSGDMEGKEYTREELREQGYNEQVIDSYWKIRNLFRKAYNQLNETRKQAKTKTGHFSGRKLDELRHNKFVEILRETDQDDGSTLVSYKEYGNWQAHYLVNEDELKSLENDDNIQILEKVPTKEGPMDGQKHWKVITREGVPDIHDRKGYVPHFFHEYMVRFVDSHGKATVVSSGRTIREATKNAIKWQAENEKMLKKRNEEDWKITIAPKVFDFGEIGLDESQYATTVGDKDFYKMEKKIADKHSMTLHEAKEMLDGMVKKKGRHRFFGNFLRRTGADGYEQEIEWVLRHYFNSTSRYVAMESKFKPQAISLFERLFGRFDNEYHGLPDYIKKYINDINGNPSTLEKQLNDLLNAIPAIGKWVNARFGDRAAVSLANSITNKISIAKLGFLNVSSAMLNILQIANAAAYTGNISTLWKSLLKGAHRKYSLHDLKILRETNVLNDIGLDSGAGYGKFSAGKWANRGMILFKESEGIVRRGVTLAAYETARKRGMSHEEAIRYAKDVNRKSNFDYGVHDAPGIFRRGSIFSQIFLQFKKYPIKQLEAMKDFLPFFGKETTKKQKAIFWGTYFAMAGLFQIPFANILGLLIMGITGDDPEKEAKKSLIELAENYPSLKPLAKIGMYGIGTFANIDITSRVGIGDAVPDDLQSLFGPAASTLFNVAKSAYSGDNWTKQVRNVSPGLGNLLMAAQGNSVGKRGRVNQEYTTPYQRLLRGMGFQSTDESDSYLIQSILSSEKKKASSKKQQLIDEYIANPTGENARKLKNAGIKPSTVKAEQKKKKLDTKGRTESTMNKNDKKQYQYLLDW